MHVSESSVPKGSGLKVAPVGIENTIRLHTAENPHRETINLLELICSVGVLSDISVAQVSSVGYGLWRSLFLWSCSLFHGCCVEDVSHDIPF